MTTTDGQLALLDAEPDTSPSTVTATRTQPKRRRKAQAAPTVETVPAVLYMLSPQKFMSPFDVNMAVDSGFNVVLPYENVLHDDVRGLIQDAMFSRPPQHAYRTGVFIGGKDIGLALDMMATAKQSMMKPFEISMLVDPGGSFTTAAALVACVERALARHFGRNLKDLRVATFGAGCVGFAASVLASLEGAHVSIVGHQSKAQVASLAEIARERFNATIHPVLGKTVEQKSKIVAGADIVLATGPAGVNILTRRQISRSTRLLIATDVNAVAPAGIEGMELKMDGLPLLGSAALGIGPLTIGDLKYKVQAGLLRRMLETRTPVELDFRDAFSLARTLAPGAPKAATSRRNRLA